jgi:hypothetical protein
LDEDYTDLFFTTGAQAYHSWSPGPGWKLGLEGRWEEHSRGRDVVSSDTLNPRFRPVLRTNAGSWRSFGLDLSGPTPWESLTFSGQALLGRFDNRTFSKVGMELTLDRSSLERGLGFSTTLAAGALIGDPPLQAEVYLGGRGTIPGYDFRSFSGSQYWLWRAEAAGDLWDPWVRLRLFGAAGGAGTFGEATDALPGTDDTDPGLLVSAGAGIGLFWDVLRLDLARGLREGGNWEVVFSVNQAFWPWL